MFSNRKNLHNLFVLIANVAISWQIEDIFHQISVTAPYKEFHKVPIGMRLADLILQKLLRVKQIEDNKGKTLVSEGIDANYQDMINYSIFALILLDEQKN